jgi:hypothetical protein
MLDDHRGARRRGVARFAEHPGEVPAVAFASSHRPDPGRGELLEPGLAGQKAAELVAHVEAVDVGHLAAVTGQPEILELQMGEEIAADPADLERVTRIERRVGQESARDPGGDRR